MLYSGSTHLDVFETYRSDIGHVFVLIVILFFFYKNYIYMGIKMTSFFRLIDEGTIFLSLIGGQFGFFIPVK